MIKVKLNKKDINKILNKYFKNYKIRVLYLHHLIFNNLRLEILNEKGQLIALFRGDRKTGNGKLIIIF